ncbi:DNA-processing protein DprA [Desulfosarcina ovata]|uniref:DNA polymerase n=1 Tax=Desulfosarcina ovata subsp. ovata TaxID=2752305 RepID=A0A5K8A911_9BACT|nr:DNA-processing protein DprA [Desulfosarcina ovata]BBO89017.1 DNA polymerase [Desulfosarcina ovata subsp. ovata]
MSELRPWFALKSVPGVGNLLYRRLVEHFGSPQDVLNAEPAALTAVQGVSPRLAASIVRHRTPDAVSDAIERELASVRQKSYRIVTLTDAGYPPLLRQIPDPPPFLYVYGTLREGGLNIAMVGSRNATDYGIATTRRLAMDLARQQVCIVSGMARGVDTAAHNGAIAAGGNTIAVLGTGLARIYPQENERLFHRIAENGAVISEFALHSGPDAHHFPARNRIISGMSHGTVVVEATGRSGSLITARLAAEQNRDVFAVPGNVHSFKSVGTHSLIKQGAKLVVHAGDIMDEFSHLGHSAPATPSTAAAPCVELTNEEAMVMDKLDAEPVHIDDLARKLALPVGRLSGLLLQLEIKGAAHQTPGNRFCRVPGIRWRPGKTRNNNQEVSSE